MVGARMCVDKTKQQDAHESFILLARFLRDVSWTSVLGAVCSLQGGTGRGKGFDAGKQLG